MKRGVLLKKWLKLKLIRYVLYMCVGDERENELDGVGGGGLFFKPLQPLCIWIRIMAYTCSIARIWDL